MLGYIDKRLLYAIRQIQHQLTGQVSGTAQGLGVTTAAMNLHLSAMQRTGFERAFAHAFPDNWLEGAARQTPQGAHMPAAIFTRGGCAGRATIENALDAPPSVKRAPEA
ncbi:hypothetical protein [Streptomyces sp. NPDC058249]|uniref:hypothetical protein n=1 Tax=Streptomyces sp. NPDC058249 TaxID=3346403 RepID=UPI0036EACDA2